MDQAEVVNIATQVSSETNRKLEFKVTKQIAISEKELRQEFAAKLKTLEETMKKEM